MSQNRASAKVMRKYGCTHARLSNQENDELQEVEGLLEDADGPLT